MNTGRMRGSVRLVAVLGALASIVVASAAAANISGTAKNDALRGTVGADKLYGRAGSDKLYGLGGNDYLNGGGGNDVLVGGPGADTLVCGPGVDTALADAADKVAADCENVKGLPKPALSVADVSQAEGNGPSSLTFTVTLAKPTPRRVTVAYATADGNATAGSDYTATTGELTFAPGETSKTVSVPVLGDTTVEGDEAFTLSLSQPVNAVLGRATATGTLTNDDAPRVKPGHFHGVVNNGGSIDFDVSPDSSAMTNMTFTYTADCQPSAKLTDTLTAAGAIPINRDLTISASGSGTGFTATFGGTFTPDGASVSGTLRVHESLDYQGTHYECDSGIVGWTAGFQG
jgi:Calx-beta domain-containing protein/hemolysin type calcium-binding protein